MVGAEVLGTVVIAGAGVLGAVVIVGAEDVLDMVLVLVKAAVTKVLIGDEGLFVRAIVGFFVIVTNGLSSWAPTFVVNDFVGVANRGFRLRVSVGTE